MKVTKMHVDYWRQHQPVPAWAASAVASERRVDVNELIDAHVPMRDRRYDAHNLLSILASVRKRGELREALARMAEHPGCMINPKRRAGYCRKWLRRLDRR